MGVSEQVEKTTKVFVTILVLGLMGLIFLIVFGNLSGNLGFKADGITVINETGAFVNITGYTLTGASDVGSASFVITEVWANASGTVFLIPAANYTVSSVGVLTNNTIVLDATSYNDAKVSYTYGRDSIGAKNSDQVIGNLTGGATNFFSFSNVWFTLLAVVLLIIIAISVIRVIGGTRNIGGRKDTGPTFSS